MHSINQRLQPRFTAEAGQGIADYFFLHVGLGRALRQHVLNALDAGAEVDVVLSSEGPQSERLSPDVASALDAEPQAKVYFDALATFYRTTYIKWVESVKRLEIRTARIDEMVQLLKASKKQK